MNNEVTVTKTSGFGLLVSPETVEAAREVAKMLAASELVPKAFANKPNDILIAGAMGHRLGLDLFSSLAGIAVVNGRPTLWGDAQLAVCQARPDWGGMKVTEEGDLPAYRVHVSIIRKGHSDPYTGSFSMDDAKRAGLAGKQGPWAQHPKRMCMLRARAFALRQAFADALAGFHAREEFEGEEIDVTVHATVVPEPKPAKVRKAPAAATQTVEAEPAAATAEAQPAEEPAAEAGPTGTSVEACQAALRRLWELGAHGKARGQALLESWSIKKVAELAAVDDEARGKFIDACSEAFNEENADGAA